MKGARERPGEELPVATVDAWLKARLPTLRGTPGVTQYAGGASNWTYRLAYPEEDLVLRRPPAGTKARSAHDMVREHDVQRALAPHFPYVPRMVALCQDASVLGADFYVMQRVPGLILRANLPPDLDLPPARARALSESVVDRLVELHGVDVHAAGLEHLGKGLGYVRRQIEGWSERYRRAKTWNSPAFEGVMAWLAAHAPEDVGASLIHNDFRLDNLVLDPADVTRIVGVLDWEMATVGDPLMDLGNTLAYWVQADDDVIARRIRRQPTHLPGMLTRAEVVARYFERRGMTPRRLTFYEVYGLFRLAVIVQQIYYRYHHRQTRNPAFRAFWAVAHYLHWRCHRLLREA